MKPLSVLSFFKNPLVIIVTAALLIRLVLMPLFVYDFDIYHWALIISNINSGNNLYNLDGYYYTPVWGYILGFIQIVQQAVVDIGAYGLRFTSLLGIENLVYPYHVATIVSSGFMTVMKLPLILCDFVVGYLIYWLVKDRTGSKKKATYGLALWLFCPIIIYMSAVQSMFDTFSALLLLLTIIMFYKDKYFLGGMLFSTAVLLKFFPVFCIFVILAYIFVKHKEDGLWKKKMLETILGMAIMAVVLMFPLILNGQVGDAFSFIFGRTGGSNIYSTVFILINGPIAMICAAFFGYLMYRTPAGDANRRMFMYVMFTAAAAVLISPTPQYVIIVIPFLILHILAEDRAFMKLWVIIGIAAFLSAFLINNLSLLTTLSGYYNLVSPEWIISGMQWLESMIIGWNAIHLLTAIAQIIQYIGVILLVAFGLIEWYNERIPQLSNFILRIKEWGSKEETENES